MKNVCKSVCSAASLHTFYDFDYCDNDPVNYIDPTGEISNILGGEFGFSASMTGSMPGQFSTYVVGKGMESL